MLRCGDSVVTTLHSCHIAQLWSMDVNVLSKSKRFVRELSGAVYEKNIDKKHKKERFSFSVYAVVWLLLWFVWHRRRFAVSNIVISKNKKKELNRENIYIRKGKVLLLCVRVVFSIRHIKPRARNYPKSIHPHNFL